MKYMQLGMSNLKVSSLGLGTINFGTSTKEEDAYQLMDTYVEQGGNFFDTSNNYAIWNGGDGSQSERTIGEWLKMTGARSNIVLATKVGALPKDVTKTDFSNMQGLSHSVITESVERSLEHLQTEYIDLLYLHVDDYKTPQEETLETLNDLCKKGYIKEIGCSNFWTWRIESARRICKEKKYKFFSAVQDRYTYLAPSYDAKTFPQVVADDSLSDYIKYYNDMTFVAYSPLLHGQYNHSEIMLDEYKTFYNEQKLKTLLSQQENPNSWVLQYITKQFGGSVALLTSSSTKHLRELMVE